MLRRENTENVRSLTTINAPLRHHNTVGRAFWTQKRTNSPTRQHNRHNILSVKGHNCSQCWQNERIPNPQDSRRCKRAPCRTTPGCTPYSPCRNCTGLDTLPGCCRKPFRCGSPALHKRNPSRRPVSTRSRLGTCWGRMRRRLGILVQRLRHCLQRPGCGSLE